MNSNIRPINLRRTADAVAASRETLALSTADGHRWIAAPGVSGWLCLPA
jgi:hypothetical protein